MTEIVDLLIIGGSTFYSTYFWLTFPATLIYDISFRALSAERRRK